MQGVGGPDTQSGWWRDGGVLLPSTPRKRGGGRHASTPSSTQQASLMHQHASRPLRTILVCITRQRCHVLVAAQGKTFQCALAYKKVR